MQLHNWWLHGSLWEFGGVAWRALRPTQCDSSVWEHMMPASGVVARHMSKVYICVWNSWYAPRPIAMLNRSLIMGLLEGVFGSSVQGRAISGYVRCS